MLVDFSSSMLPSFACCQKHRGQVSASSRRLTASASFRGVLFWEFVMMLGVCVPRARGQMDAGGVDQRKPGAAGRIIGACHLGGSANPSDTRWLGIVLQ